MAEHLFYKIQTQNGLILRKMKSEPERWFLVSDFCGGSKDCPFVGYKASTRIAEMQKEGILTSRWSERKTDLGTKLKEYKIDTENYDVDQTEDEIKLEKKPEYQDTLFDIQDHGSQPEKDYDFTRR